MGQNISLLINAIGYNAAMALPIKKSRQQKVALSGVFKGGSVGRCYAVFLG
ncbi:hypothetical protein LFREDSHE_44390 [Shewanella baltica]